MVESCEKKFERWRRKGDTDALADVFDAIAPRLLRLAIHLVGDVSAAEDLVGRYASRWGIEQAFADARQIVGVGEARNRTRRAVERTVPFGLICFSVVTVWYALHGHAASALVWRSFSAWM